jgi:hypothetical protein
MASLAAVVLPKYEEGFDLISCAKNDDGVQRMSQRYRRIVHNNKDNKQHRSITSSANVKPQQQSS